MLKTWSKPRAGKVVLPLKKMIYEFLKITVRSQTPLPGPGLYRMEGKADVRDGPPSPAHCSIIHSEQDRELT